MVTTNWKQVGTMAGVCCCHMKSSFFGELVSCNGSRAKRAPVCEIESEDTDFGGACKLARTWSSPLETSLARVASRGASLSPNFCCGCGHWEVTPTASVAPRHAQNMCEQHVCVARKIFRNQNIANNSDSFSPPHRFLNPTPVRTSRDKPHPPWTVTTPTCLCPCWLATHPGLPPR